MFRKIRETWRQFRKKNTTKVNPEELVALLKDLDDPEVKAIAEEALGEEGFAEIRRFAAGLSAVRGGQADGRVKCQR